MNSSTPWYTQAFGAHYLKLYAHRDHAEAGRVLELLFTPDELAEGRFLDVATGAGRYLAQLEQRGASAWGLDLSWPLLREARANVNLPLILADMRHLPLIDGSFDWVLSMFTSFGYFDTVSEHSQLAAEWSRVARRGIVVDVPDPTRLRRELVGHSQREVGDVRIDERRTIETSPPRVVKRVRMFRSDDPHPHTTYEERVMLFDQAQLIEIFAQAGVQPTRCFGSYEGEAYVAGESPRQLIRFERGPA